jgi:hypothetical protein
MKCDETEIDGFVLIVMHVTFDWQYWCAYPLLQWCTLLLNTTNVPSKLRGGAAAQ